MSSDSWFSATRSLDSSLAFPSLLSISTIVPAKSMVLYIGAPPPARLISVSTSSVSSPVILRSSKRLNARSRPLLDANDVRPAGGEAGPSAEDGDRGLVPPANRRRTRRYPCPYCGKGYTGVKRHIDEVHLHRKSFQCTIRGCQRVFARNDQCKSHQIFHHADSQLLSAHDVRPAGGESGPAKDDHTDAESVDAPGSVLRDSRDPRRCPLPYCGKYFSSACHATRHIKVVHLGIRPFPCEFRGCGRAFVSRWHQKRHHKTHPHAPNRMTRPSKTPSRSLIGMSAAKTSLQQKKQTTARRATPPSVHTRNIGASKLATAIARRRDISALKKEQTFKFCPISGCMRQYDKTDMRRHLADAHGQTHSSEENLEFSRQDRSESLGGLEGSPSSAPSANHSLRSSVSHTSSTNFLSTLRAIKAVPRVSTRLPPPGTGSGSGAAPSSAASQSIYVSSSGSSPVVLRKSKRIQAMLGPPASQLHGAQDVQPAGSESGPPSATKRDTESVAAPSSALPDSRDPRRCCPIPGCGKVLSRVNNVARHIDSVHRRKTTFPCTFRGCQRTFARHDYLTSHQKVHRSTTSHDARNATRFHCPYCGKALCSANYVTLHINAVHLHKKDFLCTFRGCTNRYAYPSDLKKHQNKHFHARFSSEATPMEMSNAPSGSRSSIATPAAKTLSRQRKQTTARMVASLSVQTRNASASKLATVLARRDVSAPKIKQTSRFCPISGCTKQYDKIDMRRHLVDAHGQTLSTEVEISHHQVRFEELGEGSLSASRTSNTNVLSGFNATSPVSTQLPSPSAGPSGSGTAPGTICIRV
ncbi:hypothetical protein FA95DRAFT_672753 [Auriscalpium vulgare]|uniref:Uncharacterized protein n=1 Tax=Auriscalpium vulgare TaxID=40419 RepID=A0ACB8RDF5_9AGAM|nr:hypothetical protein FA95DRAFT_672753 [Auriscalpium vulgare]